MTTPSLVEEVAKTIGRQVADLDVAPRGHWELAARAAIAVVLRRMEEPSDGMINAAVKDWMSDHQHSYKRMWHAMLAVFRREKGLE